MADPAEEPEGDGDAEETRGQRQQPYLDPRRTAEGAVVPLLQPGQPHLVAGHHRAVGVVDDLLGRLSDGAEDGPGEVPRGGQHLLALDRQRALDREHLGVGRSGIVGLAVRDRLDEGVIAGGGHQLAIRGRIDVDELRELRRRGGGRVAVDHGLVDPDPHHRSQLGDHVVVLAQHLAAVGRHPSLAEPVRPVELRLDDRGLPGRLPPSGVVLELGGGGVRPLLRHAREGPGDVQGGRGRRPRPVDLADADDGRHRAHAADEGLERRVHVRARWRPRTRPASGPSCSARPPARSPPAPGHRRWGWAAHRCNRSAAARWPAALRAPTVPDRVARTVDRHRICHFLSRTSRPSCHPATNRPRTSPGASPDGVGFLRTGGGDVNPCPMRPPSTWMRG